MTTLSAPNTKRGRLQRTCLELLQDREHQPDGLPTSTRFIYYELVQGGIVLKKREAGKTGRRSDQDVCDAIFFLRKVGEIPWDWIVDETRTIEDWDFASSVAEYVKGMVDRARIDVWNGAAPPMILTELRSLAGVLRNLAYQYLVPIAAGQRVLYLGDWDWQGAQIETNTHYKIRRSD